MSMALFVYLPLRGAVVSRLTTLDFLNTIYTSIVSGGWLFVYGWEARIFVGDTFWGSINLH